MRDFDRFTPRQAPTRGATIIGAAVGFLSTAALVLACAAGSVVVGVVVGASILVCWALVAVGLARVHFAASVRRYDDQD